jgi:23S rRNA (pseudouridine1915-N3)-methyltransferase
MKFTLFNIGKTDTKYIAKGIAEYYQRIKHYIDFSIVDIPSIRQNRNLTEDIYKLKEGELLKKALSKSDVIILLDENGAEFDSRNFAKWLNKIMIRGTRNVAFVTGGAYGFSDEVYKISHYKISLSRMTFAHQLARLIFVEQLYRACTILKGIPYHND